MTRELAGRVWIVAAAPLALVIAAGAGFYLVPRLAEVASPAECVALLALSALTGLCVLGYVLAGWLRGRHALRRADVLAAIVFAALDVLIPAGIAALVWWIVHSFKGRLIPFL
jgi:hypothetical protein